MGTGASAMVVAPGGAGADTQPAAGSPGPATAAIEHLGSISGLTREEILARSAAGLEMLVEQHDIKVRALMKKAREIGVDGAKLEEAAAGENTRGAILELILGAAKVEAAAEAEAAAKRANGGLKAELAGLSVMALEQRAEKEGVDDAKLDEAMEAANSKEAIIALILDKVQPKSKVEPPDDRFEDKGPVPGAADKPLRQGTLTTEIGSEEVVAKKHADEESFRVERDNLKEAQKDQGKDMVVKLKGVHEPTGMIYLEKATDNLQRVYIEQRAEAERLGEGPEHAVIVKKLTEILSFLHGRYPKGLAHNDVRSIVLDRSAQILRRLVHFPSTCLTFR